MSTKEAVSGFRFRFSLLCAAVVAASSARAADKTSYEVHMQPLPGATAAGVTMDYIAFDPATRFVWAPAGNTGLVVVIDSTSGRLPRARVTSSIRCRMASPTSRVRRKSG